MPFVPTARPVARIPRTPHPRTVTEEKAMHVQIIRLIHIYPSVFLNHIIVFVAIHVLGLLILARIEGLVTLKHACSLNRWQRR